MNKNSFSVALVMVMSCAISQATLRKLNPAAHSHGQAVITLAFDKGVGKLEIEVAAESIVGFEHKPKSEADTKKVEEASQIFEAKIKEIVKLDPSLACEFKKNTIVMVHENAENETSAKPNHNHHKHSHGADHADFSASFDITCKKSPVDTTVEVDFTQTFPKVKAIDLTALVEQIQKSVKKKASKVDLKISN